MAESPPATTRSTGGRPRLITSWIVEAVLVIAAFAALAAWLYHPLFSDMTRSLLGGATRAIDIKLSLWVMAWDWHALTTAPGALFDANINFPTPSALAGSEHMLGHLPIFGPLYGLSGNPVLAFQLNMLLNYALCGAAIYALLRHWQVPRAAAFFGGFVYAFAPVRGPGHPHLLAGQYLPLALIYFDRTLANARIRDAALFTLFLTLQLFVSYYLVYVGLAVLGGYAVGAVLSKRTWPSSRAMATLGGALATSAIALLLVSLPYFRMRASGMIPDYATQSELVSASATDLWRNYLYPSLALLNGTWTLPRGLSVYVGLLPLLLCFLARAPRDAPEPTRWAPAAALGAAAACYILGLGPTLDIAGLSIPLPYEWAQALVPGFSSVRVASRFGLGFMIGLASLAGLGLGALLRRWQVGGPLSATIVGLLCLGTAFDYGLLRDRFTLYPTRVGDDLPRIYTALDEAPTGAVLEIPFEAKGRVTDQMLYSTYHWKPLLAGYSGYRPPASRAVLALAGRLPDPQATRLLHRATGVRYVLVHLDQLPPQARAAWSRPTHMEQRASVGDDRLFEITGLPEPDLVDRLLDRSAETTLVGTERRSLHHDQPRAEIRLKRPLKLRPLLRRTVRVTNRSNVTWPVLTGATEHVVTLVYRWEDADGQPLYDTKEVRLPYDLAPGDSVEIPLTLAPYPGAAQLRIGIQQDGVWFPGALVAEPDQPSAGSRANTA